MRLDVRLIGIAISMIAIILFALDFKNKIENFNNVYENTTKILYDLRQNIYVHDSIVNESIVDLYFNNDRFTTNYKHLLAIKNSIEETTELKNFFPKISEKLTEIIDAQKETLNKTDDFIKINAKIKNSISILYQRVNSKLDETYKENLMKFLLSATAMQSNLSGGKMFDERLYDFFNKTQVLNNSYKLNFIHIRVIYNELPALIKIIDSIKNDNTTKHLNIAFELLDEESEQQKRGMHSKLFMITVGSMIFFFVILILARDIKVQLEKLREKDKLLFKQSKHAAMGEIIDAVAHQWRQPINLITMRVDLLGYEFDDKIVDKKYINEFQDSVFSQITHMTNTLEEFRGFLRPNRVIKPFSVEKSVKGVFLLLNDELLKHKINTHTVVISDFEINGIENEFKHVLINLINNAKDAFLENEIKDKNITITIDGKQIKVKDNAGGIPKHVINKIFEANFTTKSDDKGTGIGLYMTKQILDKIDATIDVQNVENGACFTIKVH